MGYLRYFIFDKKTRNLSQYCCSLINWTNYTYDYNNFRKQDNFYRNAIIGASIFSYLTYKIFYSKSHLVFLEQERDLKPGIFRPDLPNFKQKDVSEHSEREKGIWVTYKNGVYDITEFVDSHPGGKQILLAAGSSLEPFWKLYGQHNAEFVYEILESYRIGNITNHEKSELSSDLSDPFASDPKRHKTLIPASQKPFNAEAPPSLLRANFITPNELFYVRNHLPVPEIDPNKYELEISFEGADKKNNKGIKLSLNDLKKFPEHTLTATIMCAGNRRSEMVQVKPVKGLNWNIGAVGNAQWTGVYLRDVLSAIGVNENSDFEHVQFEGADLDPSKKPYGASIPFWKAVDRKGDVLLAYKMNGEPIPRDHGFPIRVIVPGVVGARNVKWLNKIILSKNESDSHWQQNDYKGFSPSVDWDTVDFSKSPAIQELPVTSAICIPSPNEEVQVEDGHIKVLGYAWAGGGQKIVRVDVSIDGGKTWLTADITEQELAEHPRHWAWSFWTAQIDVSKGAEQIEIWVKAVDSTYNTQPESFKNIWNLRGVLSNAYHRVPVKLKWHN